MPPNHAKGPASPQFNRKRPTLRPTDGLGLALQIMAWTEVRHLPVLEGDQLAGLVTEHDLSQVKRAFDLNGYVGIVYFVATALSLYIG